MKTRISALVMLLRLLLFLACSFVSATCPIRNTGISIRCDVTVRTGSVQDAGTDANVHIIFHGTTSSNRFYLDNSQDNFEKGNVDIFKTYIPDLFPLTHIDVGHDNQFDKSGWFLDSIDVYCPNGEIDVNFPCNRWLASDEEDGKLEVTLWAKNKKLCSTYRQSPVNGRVSCNAGEIWGSQCTYTCNDEGYRLQGLSCVHCREDETWSATEGATVCEDLCHWRRSHCWPGMCDGSNLAKTCTCQGGFKLKQASSRLCDLDTNPHLSTCRVAVTDSYGTSKNSSYSGTLTNCQNQRDEGIKTVPTELYFVMKAGLDLPLPKHQPYVSSSKVGVIGLYLTVVHRTLRGTEVTVKQETHTGPPFCQRSVSSLDPVIGGVEHDCEGTVLLSSLALKDGDSLCADMKGAGGGYYTVNDYRGVFNSNQTFTPTYTSKRVCFIYDMTKPVHCTQTGHICSSEPLTLSTRLTRYPEVEVTVDGWVDPRPPGGESNNKSASGVEWFQLEVHNINFGLGILSVEHGAITELSQKWNVSLYSYPKGAGLFTVTATLPQNLQARLYALILEVHDKAGNVGYARRLVLYDNSSTVELMPETSLRVIHANSRSNYRWQTDISRPLCVNWTGHFYNTELYSNNFLMPVLRDDTGRNISGLYDQTTDVLPVSGTNNVLGVTKFDISFSREFSPKSPYTEIADVFDQTTCLQLQQSIKDGETYDIFIRAMDIMSNTKEDSVRVSIDHTGPEVSVWGLRGRWDTDGLYVHNSTDLSTMKLVLTAQDPHSGLATVHWTLGSRPLANDVGERAVGVQRLDNTTACDKEDNCYCPSVGDCEIFRYVVAFPNLVHINRHQGDHHRDYYVTITVTNIAGLSTVTPFDLLLDESPPTVGVVWEGLSDDGQAEMDFTSSRVVHSRWHGYEDHESGMRLYRVVLAQRCMTAEEVDAAPNATVVQHPENKASFVFPQEGHYYVSVVGYNGAMEPTKVACSDGIIYDTTPPAFFNVSITHARSGRMVGCTHQGEAWLVNSNLTRVALSNVTQCKQVCSLNSSLLDVRHFPESSSHTTDPQLSDRYCQDLPAFNQDSYIVLPSDYVRVAWQGCDNESEMEEYYIGMGRDRSSFSAPDLLPFNPTHGHPSYHARHVGLSHGDVFFIFLQVVTKAGLSTSLTLGPVLIDVTAPDVTQQLTAIVEGDYLKVSWGDEVFTDPEQPENVDFDLTFRVGYDGGFITPFLELPKFSMATCRHDNVTGCARYPVTALYDHDTQQGRSFFFQMHVKNAAGHVTTVNTSAVRLPLHYPPNHVVVVDMLSDSSDVTLSEEKPSVIAQSVKDVDVIVQQQQVCTAWGGFYQPNAIRVEVGLGTFPDHDDVISFQPVKNVSHACFNVTSTPVYTQMFSVVRATSSGGTVFFSSDGFVMVPQNDSDNDIRVFNGAGCHDSDIVGSRVFSTFTDILELSHITKSVHPGDILFVQLSPFVQLVTFTNATLMQTTLTGYQILTSAPNVSINMPVSVTTNVSIHIFQCQKVSELLNTPFSHMNVAWELRGPWQRWIKYMRVEIMDTGCLHMLEKNSQHSQQQCLLHQATVRGRERELRVPTTDFHNDHTYVTKLQPCFDDGCLPPVTSSPVTFIHELSLALSFSEAILVDVNGGEQEMIIVASVEVTGSVESLSQRQQSQPCVYQWSICRDSHAALPLTDWTVEQTDNCSVLKIDRKVTYSGDGKGSLYICLYYLYPTRTPRPRCSRLTRSARSTKFQPFHVVELDHRTFLLIHFEPFLQSQQLGMKLYELLDNDLDFARSDVMLSAVLTNSQALNVTWFLMTEPRVADRGECAGDDKCVTSSNNEKGFITFPRHRSVLQNRGVYFICALISQDTAFHVCGDGVVIDDDPPTAGVVTIDNADNGFLAYGGQVRVVWSDFSDVETEGSYLPETITVNYSVALGSSPGMEDVAGFVLVGQRNSWSFVNINIQSGTTLSATVRAQDRVGHRTEVTSDQVIVDSSPPTVGRVAAGTITAQTFVSGQELSVHWEAVEDNESGIKAIQVGLAQEESGDTVIDFQSCKGTSTTLTDTSSILDGNTYVILLKVTNRAGLTTLSSSEPFVYDNSCPSPGHVWYSGINVMTPSGYSHQVGVVSVEWAGFADPHSSLQYYRVGLGSTPGDTDALPFVYVGLHTAYTWREDLSQGTKYYAAIEACNRAGLCRVTSSGSIMFDNSPPTAGQVTVGLFGRHDKFLGHSSALPVQWTGFSDPQTGIQHYTWCVGTAPRVCNVTAPANSGLTTEVHSTELALPAATFLYVTVRARNPAGLESVSVSDSFQVDPTPPEVVIKPHFLSPRHGGPTLGQWDRTVLHVTWEFRDPESSVVSHTVYVHSKLTGRLVVEPVLLGAQDELMLTLDKDKRFMLADGDSHWTSVTACNAAHLCVTATSDVISVDSTPPVTGTFLSPLRWTRGPSNVTGDVVTAIDVTWRSFSDPESGVATYRLLVGRDYNGQELSEGRVENAHDNVSVKQSYSLEMREELQADALLHLALLAENALGLTSPLVRAAFRCLRDNQNGTSGTLVLVRHSCQASYCTKECTCAATGKLCEDSTTACVDLDPSRPDLSQLSVLPLMGPPGTQHRQFSTSAKCLEGHWSLLHPESLVNVSRFQYSFSFANMPAGQGIFNVQTERVWYDVGRHMTALHCRPGTETLQSGQRYVLHVRVWPSSDSRVTFTSPPMMVDHTPPRARHGRSVIESDLSCASDIDYVTKQDIQVTACWAGVFLDSESAVSSYKVWMGTSRQGSDHIGLMDVGLNTSWTFPTMPLEHGTRYYVTVQARNYAGLTCTAVSDGFLIDVTSPVPGVVFNTGNHSNIHAQSSAKSISASWHGFEDRHSGVRSYHVAVYDVENVTHPVMPFTDVGVTTELLLQNLNLQHLRRYRVSVKCKDAAGLESHVVESEAFLVDTTQSEGVVCTEFRLREETTMFLHSPTPSHLHDRYVGNLTLEASERGVVMRVEVMAAGISRFADGFLQVAQYKMPLHFRFWPSRIASAYHDFLSPDAGTISIHVVVEAPRGANITSRLYQCQTTVVSTENAVSLLQMSSTSVSVCARILDKESGLRTMMVGVGTTEGGLQVAPWTAVGQTGHVTIPVHVQHASPLYATVVSQNQARQWSRFVSRPITFDLTPPRLSDVGLVLRYEGEGQDNATEVWAEAAWSVEDRETGVETCTCRIDGQTTVEPSVQLLDGSSEGRCQWQLRDPHHGSEVKVTVTCINNVQLLGTTASLPVMVLLRPPDVSLVLLSSLSNNALMSPYQSTTPQVRSGNSSLQFFWSGIQNPAVTTIYFRLLLQSRPLTEWSPLHGYKTAAILERELGRSGLVTAEWKAVNERLMTSEVVSATALLDDSTPLLSGQAATVSVYGQRVRLEWSRVFRVTRDATFSVFAGSERGYGDVINHVITTALQYEGYSAVTVTSKVYVNIQAVYDNGASTTYQGTLIV